MGEDGVLVRCHAVSARALVAREMVWLAVGERRNRELGLPTDARGRGVPPRCRPYFPEVMLRGVEGVSG